jgi:DNA-directed RNA polymerase specialized sigma subunit
MGVQMLLTEMRPATREVCYCDGGKRGGHIRVKMLWQYPYWYCDICGRRVYDGKLKNWHRLDAEKRRLEAKIVRLEELLQNLRRSVSMYHSPVIDGMPRGTDVSDPVGEFVTRLDEKIKRTEVELIEARIRYEEVCIQLDEIERTISELSDRYRRLMEMVYRDRASYQSVCSALNISTPRMYQMRDEAIDALEGLI